MLRLFIAGNLPAYVLLMFVASIVVALTFHEFAHGFAAYLLGDRTAKHDGRLSFNPVKHIDPIGMMLLLVAGFGWAKPVMVNPYNLKNPKQDMAFISIAGPVANFIMAFVALLTVQALLTFAASPAVIRAIYSGATGNEGAMYFLIRFLIQLCSLNIGLGLFNLIPIPPLDGSKFFGFFLPDHLYFRLINFRHGFLLLIALVFSGAIEFIVGPVFDAVFSGMAFVVTHIVSVFV